MDYVEGAAAGFAIAVVFVAAGTLTMGFGAEDFLRAASILALVYDNWALASLIFSALILSSASFLAFSSASVFAFSSASN